jgi:hypothetical protein
MSMKRLIDAKTTMGFKLESTPYTAETSFAAADFGYSVHDITWNNEIDMHLRKLARGDYSRDKAVAGKRRGTVSFKVDVHPGGNTTTPPRYFALLRACGLKQTAGASGVKVETDSSTNNVPATIEIRLTQEGTTPKQLYVRMRGCMGNAAGAQETMGQPHVITFTFTGVPCAVGTIASGSVVTPSSFDTRLPPATLSATIQLFGTLQYPGRFSWDLGNVVELFTDPSKPEGYEGARVVDRVATMEMEMDMFVTDDRNPWNAQISNNTGVFDAQIGDNLTLYAPAAQYEQTLNHGSREGHAVDNIRCGLKRSSGNDEFKIVQGTVA